MPKLMPRYKLGDVVLLKTGKIVTVSHVFPNPSWKMREAAYTVEWQDCITHKMTVTQSSIRCAAF